MKKLVWPGYADVPGILLAALRKQGARDLPDSRKGLNHALAGAFTWKEQAHGQFFWAEVHHNLGGWQGVL